MNRFRGPQLSPDQGGSGGGAAADFETEIRGATFAGHPTGLFALFFAEMWERFSYYGMRALLIFYMTKGFLQFDDDMAYGIYGAYTALVYMTPFFGGMIADRYLGPRIAVVLGGVLMAAGHLLMGIENSLAFYTALALLIAGNGFFKPNISTMVGSLYPAKSPKRDGGFTIFYIGINLGAAMSPLLCGYIGETEGWHWGFGLATIGMLVGLATFVMPTLLSQGLILIAAAAATYGLIYYRPDNAFTSAANYVMAVALAFGAISAVIALSKGGLPSSMGLPPKGANVPKALGITLVGTLVSIVVFTLLVSGLSMFNNGVPVSVVPDSYIKSLGADDQTAVNKVLSVLLGEISKPAGLVLSITGILALGYLGWEMTRMGKIARERMQVVLILTFFSFLFWAFFEQAGSSLNNFTDRNVDRVTETRTVAQEEVGQSIRLQPTQEQLGFSRGPWTLTRETFDALKKDENLEDEKDIALLWVVTAEQVGRTMKVREDKPAEGATARKLVDRTLAEGDIGQTIRFVPTEDWIGQTSGGAMFTLTHLTVLREVFSEPAFEIDWNVQPDNVGMGVAEQKSEIPASFFQAINPGFIMILGLVFTTLWTILANLRLEPSTPIKFSLGLIQLGLGFYCFYMGAAAATERGMVAIPYLVFGYLFQTTGELCLSPVGLSMVTKLAPKVLVSTVMGSWFLATALSQYLAGIISKFTAVGHGGEGEKLIPVPSETVNVYGGVYYQIAIAAMIAGGICLLLSPVLSYWMHKDAETDDDGGSARGH